MVLTQEVEFFLLDKPGSESKITPETHQELGSLSFLAPQPLESYLHLSLLRVLAYVTALELQVESLGPWFPHLYVQGVPVWLALGRGPRARTGGWN